MSSSGSEFLTGIDQPQFENKRYSKLLLLSIAVCIFGSALPTGHNIGVMNAPQEIIRDWINATVLQEHGSQLDKTISTILWSIIISCFIGGAAIGSFVAASLADSFGRRSAILINHLTCASSGLLFLLCKPLPFVEIVLIARFVAGLCAGLSTGLVPMYLSEVAPPCNRGVMGVVMPFGLCLGLLISQILGMDNLLGTHEAWFYLVGGYFLYVFVALVFHPIIPESPAYYYIMTKDPNKGIQELRRLRAESTSDIATEDAELRAAASMFSKSGNNKWSFVRIIKTPDLMLPLLVVVVINCSQQLSGINAVFYYSTLIFQEAGLTLQQSQLASIGAGIVNFLMASLALPLIRHCRRRHLLLSSLLICVICQLTLLVALRNIQSYPWAPGMAISSLVSYVFFYGIGLGPVPYMIGTELFPPGPRATALAMGGMSNWMFNLVVGLCFPVLQQSLQEFSFCLFMAVILLTWLFVYKYMPETLERKTSSYEDTKC